jgi:hypothetical protein
VKQTTEGEGPASETGRGFFAFWKQFARASRAFRCPRCPYSSCPSASMLSPQSTYRERCVLKYQLNIGCGATDSVRKPGGVNRKLRRDALTGTLSAKFVEEVVLLQRGPLAQQFEQRIFERLRGRVVSPLRAVLELAEVRG